MQGTVTVAEAFVSIPCLYLSALSLSERITTLSTHALPPELLRDRLVYPLLALTARYVVREGSMRNRAGVKNRERRALLGKEER